MRIAETAIILGAVEPPHWLADIEAAGYSIDSRTVQAGEIFFAVKGERFDGHEFVSAALAKGAFAAVVSRSVDVEEPHRLITVQEPLAALQELASEVLRRWGRPVTAITGSAGKTTTKELAAAVLSAKGRVLKSAGNLNNTFGLPLSVLQMETGGARPADFDFAVLEMGMSSPGEIRRLCEIAPPDVGAVINVNAAHLEFFPSIEAIAEAKTELVEGLKPGGLAALNADDRLVKAMRARHDGPAIMFGIENDADVRAVDLQENGLFGTNFRLITPSGETEAHLPLAGRHSVYNALAAAAIGDHYGVSLQEIAARLAAAKPASHRGEVLRFKEGFWVVDDSYNSNPRALDEMVRVSASALAGDAAEAGALKIERRIVAAGEMLELGESGAELHRKCGENIARCGIDLLIGVRGLAREIARGANDAGMAATLFFESSEEAAEWMTKNARRGDLVLVKGSRGVKTEIIVDALKRSFEAEGA